jgi:hypothetical protein
MEIHSDNRDWIDLISEIFTRHSIKHFIDDVPPRDRMIGNRVIHGGRHVSIRTSMYRNLYDEYVKWYPNGKKVIPSMQINPVTLAHWYMGDGCLSKNKICYIRICFFTNGFKWSHVNVLKNIICDTYNIHGAVGLNSRKEPVLRFTSRNALFILDMIRSYIVPSFSYKTNNIYLLPKCEVCGIGLNRHNAKYCALCLPSIRQAYNQNRHINVNIISLAKKLQETRLKCFVCDSEFSDRIGSKYCFRCRDVIRKAYKVVRYHTSRDSSFDLISYVRAKIYG